MKPPGGPGTKSFRPDMETELTRLIAGRKGHFQMESGYHSEMWFDLGRLFDRPEQLHSPVKELARRLAAHRLDAVCGPMAGGAKLAEMIGRELVLEHFVSQRSETAGAGGLFPVNYRIPAEVRSRVREKRIAVVDDAISAGSAVRGTCADLLACGARPVAVGALFIFGPAAARFAAEKDLGLEGISRMEFEPWQPAACPLCRAGVALEIISDVA